MFVRLIRMSLGPPRRIQAVLPHETKQDAIAARIEQFGFPPQPAPVRRIRRKRHAPRFQRTNTRFDALARVQCRATNVIGTNRQAAAVVPVQMNASA